MRDLERHLTGLYAAFNERRIEAVLSALDPRVEWPNGWEGGWLHGRDEVRAYWERQWREIDPTVEPVAFVQAAGGGVDVSVHQVVRDRSGAVQFDGMVVHKYEFESGLVRRMTIEHPSS